MCRKIREQKFRKLVAYADKRGVDVVRNGKRLQLRDRGTGVALHTSLNKFFLELESEVNRVVVGAANVREINARRKV